MGNFGPERVWGTFDAPGLVVKEPQIVVHKADQPDPLGGSSFDARESRRTPALPPTNAPNS
jgi:hypothetical protein